MGNSGRLVISLDFELYWGVRDRRSCGDYKGNLQGVNAAIPAILDLFKEYDIHSTWAVMGFLFYKNKAELIGDLPSKLPSYADQKYSPYPYLEQLEEIAESDPIHFAPSLVKKISATQGQEIGTHTFSHYYCLEKGQKVEEFKSDLRSAISIADRSGSTTQSIVFPRNQFTSEYIKAAHELGIKAYRGNERSWLYKEANTKTSKSILRRSLRLLDAYIPLTGHNTYSPSEISKEQPLNIPSSRFLRPYSGGLHLLESLRLNRILSDITFAAKNNRIYHIWWHPHNFGANLEENLAFLKKILEHYKKLNGQYGFKSANMKEMTSSIIQQNE